MTRETLSWQKLRYATFKRDDYTCQYCGLRPKTLQKKRATSWSRAEATLHVDHIIPLSKGGEPGDLRNLVTACATCNLQKGARLWWPTVVYCFDCERGFRYQKGFKVDIRLSVARGYPDYWCPECQTKFDQPRIERDDEDAWDMWEDDIELEMAAWDSLPDGQVV